MLPVSRNLKMYFGAVGLFALWVGVWGFFVPTEVDRAIPWLVPPLHARFIGAIYFSATVVMFGGMLAGSYADAKVSILISTIWTGMLFIISLFYLNEFDFTHKPVWFWFGAYIVYPIIGAWFLWKHRNLQEPFYGQLLPNLVKKYFLVQGVVLILLSLALLFLPDVMLNLWPWKITRLLAQIYSSPFLAYGVASVISSQQKTWHEIKVVATSIFVFAILILIASFIHIELFSFERIASYVWFGGFLISANILGLLTIKSIQNGRTNESS
ncbi:MAG: hypothetical protein KF758_07015 [Anaerolineales bacterium]|nr:hypothetical protein [Anaerolineales bacterium]MBX3036646.1 hypothetical protein [Anaerolineales bacterium]